MYNQSTFNGYCFLLIYFVCFWMLQKFRMNISLSNCAPRWPFWCTDPELTTSPGLENKLLDWFGSIIWFLSPSFPVVCSHAQHQKLSFTYLYVTFSKGQMNVTEAESSSLKARERPLLSAYSSTQQQRQLVALYSVDNRAATVSPLID